MKATEMSPRQVEWQVSSKQGNQRQELTQKTALLGTKFHLATPSWT